MLLSAIQSFTLLDYPGQSACIVFTPGCNFRCGYCHNPEFVLPEKIQQIRHTFIPESIFLHFLEKRRGLLDGIVITGGEPTLMGDLLPFMKKIKEMGFLVKLDSNGNRPEILSEAIEKNLVDYIAMDLKTNFAGYKNLVGKLVRTEKIAESINLIMRSGVDYEFRTTLVDEIHSKEVMEDMRSMIRGAKRLYLQQFRKEKTLDPRFESFQAFSSERLKETIAFFSEDIESVDIRL